MATGGLEDCFTFYSHAKMIEFFFYKRTHGSLSSVFKELMLKKQNKTKLTDMQYQYIHVL